MRKVLISIVLLMFSAVMTAGKRPVMINYPLNSPDAAVIVCPGGSYYWLDKENEGEKVAEWLNSNNIAAYVLHYRTAGVFAFITKYRLVARARR